MPKGGPIIIVEDDHDDQELLKEVFEELNIPNIIRFFSSCFKALDYLLTTIERPFLIISDINLPAMSGLEFRMKINENEYLKKKAIPFVFLTTTRNNNFIEKAYEISIQGYFVKPFTVKDLTEMVRMIIEYWNICSRPNTT
jgi:CheY-like chemotaxis protein